jgi:hypothetical protein
VVRPRWPHLPLGRSRPAGLDILGKLGVASRGEAAAKAHSLRLFDPTSTA